MEKSRRHYDNLLGWSAAPTGLKSKNLSVLTSFIFILQITNYIVNKFCALIFAHIQYFSGTLQKKPSKIAAADQPNRRS